MLFFPWRTTPGFCHAVLVKQRRTSHCIKTSNSQSFVATCAEHKVLFTWLSFCQSEQKPWNKTSRETSEKFPHFFFFFWWQNLHFFFKGLWRPWFKSQIIHFCVEFRCSPVHVTPKTCLMCSLMTLKCTLVCLALQQTGILFRLYPDWEESASQVAGQHLNTSL